MNTIKCALLIAVFFFSLSATRVIAESVEMSYDVYSKKSRVGTIKTKRTRVDNKEKPTLIIDTIGEVRVKVLFYKYSLDFTEHSVIDLHEGLISYESDTTENGKQKLVKGVFSGDSFNLSVTKKGEITKSTVLREKYETTSVETVEKRVGKNEAKRQFSVLDLDKPSIENWILGYEKEEMITIDNREFLCNVISFDGSGATGQRWIAKDEIGPFLVKETGKDKDGRYSFIMTSYSTDIISQK